MLTERCWDLVPGIRPRISDALDLFETASPGWISPTSEAIANLNLGCTTDQHPSTKEPTDTMSEAVFGPTGEGTVNPRGAGVSPPASNRT